MLDHPEVTADVIEAAIVVHRVLGPGFVERIYERALAIELRERGAHVDQQFEVPVSYRQHLIGSHVIDLLVNGQVIVELKAIASVEPKHVAVLRSHLKAANLRYGLILNFALPKLDIRRALNR